MKYYLIVGEASGDLHAAHLMRELKNVDPKAEFRFFGGDHMSMVGGTLVRHYRDTAFMGLFSVIAHLPTILRNMSMCKADIREWGPDAVILVDYPGFNLGIAKYVHSNKLAKVFYYKPEIDFPVGTSEYDPRVYEKAAENFQKFQDKGWLVQDADEH
ncbi:MAG: hypothetical protein II674_12615, partial [Prevotella sp.]|nr:hypothetical protein [Prevotella sp.]